MPFELSGTYDGMNQRLSACTRAYSAAASAGLSPWEARNLGQAINLARARAVREVMRGGSIPAHPSARQRELGLSEARYRELLPLLHAGMEQGLRELSEALRPALERYVPDCLAPAPAA